MAGGIVAQRLIVEVGTDLSELSALPAKASSTVKRASAAMSAAGSALSRTLTLPLVGVGFAAFRAAKGFHESMTQIEALVSSSKGHMEEYRQAVLGMARDVGKSPRELADALYFITSSGLSGKAALETLEASAKASAAGLGQTKVVADAVTSAINAYGEKNLSASRATDILVAAIDQGKAEPEEFAASLGRVMAPAQQMGVSFQEVTAAIASMSLQGLDAAEATTALRAGLLTFADPSEKARKALKEVGLSAAEVRRSIRDEGLLETLVALRERFKGNEEAMAGLFGNVRAFVGASILTGETLEKNRGIFQALEGAVGNTARAFDTASKDPAFRFQQAMAGLEVASVRLGGALLPLVASVGNLLADAATTAAEAFDRLPPGGKKLVIVLGAVAAAAGPAMMMVGSLGRMIAALIPVVGAVASPVGLLVAGVVALGAAITAAVLAPDKLRAVLMRLGVSARTADVIIDKLQEAFKILKTVAMAVFPVIQTVVTNALRVVGDALRLVGALIRGDWGAAWQAAKALVVDAVTGMLDSARAVLGTLGGIALSLAKAAGAKIVEGIRAGLAGLVAAVQGAFSALWDYVRGLAGTALGAAKAIGSQLIQGIKDGFEAGIGGLKGWIEGKLKSLLDTLNPFSPVEHGGEEKIGKPIALGAIKGWLTWSAPLKGEIESRLKSAVEAARTALESMPDVVGSPAQRFRERLLAELERARTGVEQVRIAERLAAEAQAMSSRLQEAESRLQSAMQRITQGLQSMTERAVFPVVRFRQMLEAELSRAATVFEQARIAERMAAQLDRMRQVIEARQAAFSAAWERLADYALRAFDARTQAGLDRIQRGLDAKIATIDRQLAAAEARINARLQARTEAIDAGLARREAGIERERDKLTPTEKLIADIEAARERRRLQDAITQAQRDYNAALAEYNRLVSSGTASEEERLAAQQRVADAERALHDAELNQYLARLQVKAERERRIRDAEAARKLEQARKEAENQRKQAEAEAAADLEAARKRAERRKAQAQAEAAERQREWEARRELQRFHLEQQLAQLEQWLARHPGKWRQATEKSLKVIMGFVPHFRDSGRELGSAFADGIEEAIKAVQNAARRLGQAAADALQLRSPAKEGPLSTLDRWWRGFADTLLEPLDVGAVRGAVAAIVSPPEMALAAAGGARPSGRGGMTIFWTGDVVVQGNAIYERDLALTVRRHLQEFATRNVGVGLG